MGFYIFISVLILIVCVLLGLIVLIQNPKGGGLSSTFGGQANQIMGVRRTTDFLEKGTWVLSVVLLFLSLIAAYSIPKHNSDSGAPQTELTVDQQSVLPTQLPVAQPVETTPTEEE
ncbi:MAG: preprotein translocase subunit SecG [Lentimicrobiaceae bacterium]|nr:preprotein translocase subunit SecG [Lentimicrobiaceae bacterium]